MMEKREQEQKNPNKPNCSHCGSKFVYIRIKDNQVVCRSCGQVTDLKKEE